MLTRHARTFFSALVIQLAATLSVSADVESAALKAFDAFCISSLLDVERFKANAGIYRGVALNKQSIELVGGGDLGFMIKLDGSIILTVIGTKEFEGYQSRNCVVMVKGLSLDASRRVIEQNFSVSPVQQFKQGMSNVTIYAADLAGFSKEMAIGLQHSTLESDVATISVFDIH